MAFLQEDGTVDVLKKDVQPWKFVSSKEYEEFINEYLVEDTRAVILHARGASQGNPRDNNNNHPMFNGKAAVIHNGSIKNDGTLFNAFGLERHAQTDSDILRAIFDKWEFTEQAFKNLNRITGSVAGAAIINGQSKKLAIFRSGSPMELGSSENFFVFSSEKNTIHAAMRPIVMRFKIPFQIQKSDLAFSLMPNHTLWILGPDGLESHHEFKTHSGVYVDPVRRVYKEYTERSRKFDEEAKRKNIIHKTNGAEEVTSGWCIDCKKEWVIPKNSSTKKWYCNKAKGGCGKQLVEYETTFKVIN